jgi:hypothetical protein
MPVDFEFCEGVAELSDRRTRRVVDEHLFGSRFRRDVVDDRDTLVEEVSAPVLKVTAHLVARDALPFQARDELAGNRVKISEDVGECLCRRLLHREHLDVPSADLQVVSVALHCRIADEVVDMRVVPQRGGVDDGFVVVHQFAKEPKRPRLRQLCEPDVVQLNLERVRFVV